MNFKQFGVLLSISIIFGMNVIVPKTLAQDLPSISFGAITTVGCSVANQPTGSVRTTLPITLDNISASEGQRQRCILRAETFIPSGFFVKDIQILYEASAKVSSMSKGASLSRTYSFSGGALGQVIAPPKTTKFISDKAFVEQDEITVLPASGLCSGGGQGLLGINIIAQSSPGSSIDISKIVIFSGNLSPC
ncbi:hypothetical protein [Nostoc sp.]|uniref:hypothetical protein n=1 Tax=Nostoc sp. TaxID=1180 RepID=UPI002FF9A1A0